MRTKKILFFFFSCFITTIQITIAQVPNLWGLTSAGGANGVGTVIKINGDGSGFSTPHVFGDLLFPGANPYGNLIRATNGKYYGLASGAGTNNKGVIFSFDSTTHTYTDLYNFDGANGAAPQGSLLQASNGILYGVTSAGGNGDRGVIFSFNISNSTYSKLYAFTGTGGSAPLGSLIQATNGLLYGTASTGGSNGSGVIFSFDPGTSAYTDLHDFDVLNGANPHGDLVQASNSKLYGTTFNGGTGNGVIFSYDISSSTYTVTQVLNTNGGFTPNGNLLSDGGTLYGMTAGGGFGYGVIYKYNPSTAIYTNLHSFNKTDGANVQAPDVTINNQLNNPPYYSDGAGALIKANDGKLYGMTNQGGANNYGVIFSINTNGTGYTDLYDFNTGVSGTYPLGSLFQASDGKLYGMTSQGDGGSGYNDGTIFSYDITGGGFTPLYDFDYDNSGNGGKYPVGNFIEPTAGKLYAMTALGGNEGLGEIFSYDITGGGYNNEYSLDNNYSAAVPLGSLVEAGGLLYGTTCNGDGGSGNNFGCVFSFDMSKGTGDNGFTPLSDFDGSGHGANPQGSLFYSASDGLLYGTTAYGDGGSGNNKGVIFSFDTNSGTLTSLLDFNGTNGANTVTGLVETGAGGDLYGTSPTGGSNKTGLIFGFNRTGTSVDTVYNFDGNSGAAHPNAGLIQASNGKLYGTSTLGGTNNLGELFSYDITGSVYAELYSFEGNRGANPSGNLIQESNGKLYGLTYAGGLSNAGGIFEFNPLTSTYTNLLGFAGGAAGANPYGSLMVASNDRLYGLTYAGGGANTGVLFSYDIPSGFSTVYLDFKGTNGASPNASLIKANNGLLYGMTSAGGMNNKGVLFSIDPVTLHYAEWVIFNGFNGANPKCNLLEANDGKLYGLTTGGGASNKGVLFSFDPSTSVYTVLVNFDGSTNGNVGPYGNGLMQAANGKLYGTTYTGITGYGNLFSYDISTSTFTDEYDWAVSNFSTLGGYPAGTLIQTGNGLLYGTIIGGGTDTNHGSGLIFTFNTNTKAVTVVHPFNRESSSTENQPYSYMLQSSNGLLYGLCRLGGFSNNDFPYGAIYSMDPSNSTIPNPTYAKVLAFDNAAKGAYPYGSLMQATDGSLYGMTNQGGTNNNGVIFKYDYSGSGTYTKLRDLATADGINPIYGNLLEAGSASTISTPGFTTGKGSSSTICVKQSVGFKDTSVYVPTNWNWSFPGGTPNSSMEQNPVITYNTAGQYDVTLTAWNSTDSGTITIARYITVNDSTTITVTPKDTSICGSSPVSLKATGDIVYSWAPSSTLSDTTGANVLATPTITTTYTVSGGACSTAATAVITITNGATAGNITATSDTVCHEEADTLTLHGNSSNIIQWQSSLTGSDFTNISGAKNATLKTGILNQATYYRAIVGSGACTDTTGNFKVQVDPLMKAIFHLASFSDKDLSFNSDSSQGHITKYLWSFGDAFTSTTPNPEHTYAEIYFYTVCLTVEDGLSCSDKVCHVYNLSTLGVNEVAAGNNWNVYPSPFSDNLIVENKLTGVILQNIAMYDVLGRAVITKNLGNSSSSTIQLDVSSLPKGMYYLNIKTNAGSYVQKVVKQ